MLRYLRMAATTQTHHFSQQMLTHGSFSFAPGSYTSRSTNLLPTELPTNVQTSLQATQCALALQNFPPFSSHPCEITWSDLDRDFASKSEIMILTQKSDFSE